MNTARQMHARIVITVKRDDGEEPTRQQVFWALGRAGHRSPGDPNHGTDGYGLRWKLTVESVEDVSP